MSPRRARLSTLTSDILRQLTCRCGLTSDRSMFCILCCWLFTLARPCCVFLKFITAAFFTRRDACSVFSVEKKNNLFIQYRAHLQLSSPTKQNSLGRTNDNCRHSNIILVWCRPVLLHIHFLLLYFSLLLLHSVPRTHG